MADKLKITLVKSPIGAVPKHKKTVAALGLKKLNKSVEMPDNAAVRGNFAQWMFISMSFFAKCHIHDRKSVKKREKCGEIMMLKFF